MQVADTDPPLPFTGDLNIENTNIKAADGVSLDEQQRTLVGSVLDVSTLAWLTPRRFQYLAIQLAFCRSAITQKAPTLGR